MVHINNGIHKKEWNNAIFSNIDGPRDYRTKWSNSEKDKCHDIIYMWILKYDTNELIHKTEKVHRHREQTCSY